MSAAKAGVENWRRIVIQIAQAIILNSPVLVRLSHYFSSKIFPHQHELIFRRSSTTNLVSFQSNILSAFEDRIQSDNVYLDFSEDFDTMNYRHWQAKLGACGVSSYLPTYCLALKASWVVWENLIGRVACLWGSQLEHLLLNILINNITRHTVWRNQAF